MKLIAWMAAERGQVSSIRWTVLDQEQGQPHCPSCSGNSHVVSLANGVPHNENTAFKLTVFSELFDFQ